MKKLPIHCISVIFVKMSFQLSTKRNTIVFTYTISIRLFIEETNIPDQIIALSPQFSTIYEQALRAEQEHLDQIAGFGYRRALEFLVKDYAISKQTDEKDKIQAMPMAQCIERFIEHPRTKALAKRAAWLGNDYAHYLKKHTDRDLKDLKALISLTVQWINLEIESTAYESEITYQK